MISPLNGPLPSGSTDVQEGALEVVAGAALLDTVEEAAGEVGGKNCESVNEAVAVEERTAPFWTLRVELGAEWLDAETAVSVLCVEEESAAMVLLGTV